MMVYDDDDDDDDEEYDYMQTGQAYDGDQRSIAGAAQDVHAGAALLVNCYWYCSL